MPTAPNDESIVWQLNLDHSDIFVDRKRRRHFFSNSVHFVQNRALDHRLLSVANWYQTPLSDEVHSARSQDTSTAIAFRAFQGSASSAVIGAVTPMALVFDGEEVISQIILGSGIWLTL